MGSLFGVMTDALPPMGVHVLAAGHFACWEFRRSVVVLSSCCRRSVSMKPPLAPIWHMWQHHVVYVRDIL